MKKIWSALLLLAVSAIGVAQPNPDPGQGFVNVPGGPVWYKIVGAGPGIPLLVLHGGPGGRSCGYSLLEPLGDQRPIVRFDQLGSGRSGRPDDMTLWTVERFVEELHVLRQQLGLERMHLLGHSWGGALAAAYVIEKGTEGIKSVILSSPLLSTPLWVKDANIQRSELPDDVLQVLVEHEKAGTTDSDEYAAAAEVYYERHMYAGDRPDPAANCEDVPRSRIIYEYMWGPQEFYATGTLIDFDLTDRLHEIDVPVLFMTGEFDEARPETVAGFQKLTPGSQFAVIKDAGHATLSKKPEEYRTVLEIFLDVVENERR